MSTVLTAIIWGHIVAGFIGLGAFWVPVFARKGSRTHVRFGTIYAWCAYVVTSSAVLTSLGRILQYQLEGIAIGAQPERYGFAVFLGYLGLATFASVRHAVRVVETRKAPDRIKTPFHRGLGWTSIGASVVTIALALAIWSPISIVLLSLSPGGIAVGSGILTYLNRGAEEHMGWFYSHMGAMIGGGIAFHTAFAVFGAQRIFQYSLDGAFAVVPWIAPTLIGVPALIAGRRYYQRRFVRVQPQTA